MIVQISSQKIKEFIEKQYAIDGMVSMHDFELWLEEQPKVGEWIPCTERLPELHEEVLCMCQADIQEVLRWTVDGWAHDSNHCYMKSFVIAWMPLPPAFKGEDNGQADSRNT